DEGARFLRSGGGMGPADFEASTWQLGDRVMLNRFHDRSRRVVAGIKLSDMSEDLIKTALTLSHRTDMSLKFTHVVESIKDATNVYPGGYTAAAMSLSEQDERIRKASTELSLRLRPYLETEEFEMTVLTGDPPDAICGD